MRSPKEFLLSVGQPSIPSDLKLPYEMFMINVKFH